MKNILLSLITIMITIIGVYAQNTLVKDSTEKKNVHIKYTCSMHPEIVSDKPGKCPKCGMDLIAVSESSANNIDSSDNSMQMMHPMMMGMNHSGNKKNRILIILGGAVMAVMMFFMIGTRIR
ncbi:heavy metal-binding domain-containing protein [Hydrotalea sp.]|uniref:heavy metal-binding domain-containing protein n=1 Tax=Hydrotalea sp. TaxID=2881279 RepID=UPI00261A205E|nr:heavy metal-binding domain-containing protein [Hydrotalea sp.]